MKGFDDLIREAKYTSVMEVLRSIAKGYIPFSDIILLENAIDRHKHNREYVKNLAKEETS